MREILPTNCGMFAQAISVLALAVGVGKNDTFGRIRVADQLLSSK